MLEVATRGRSLPRELDDAGDDRAIGGVLHRLAALVERVRLVITDFASMVPFSINFT